MNHSAREAFSLADYTEKQYLWVGVRVRQGGWIQYFVSILELNVNVSSGSIMAEFMVYTWKEFLHEWITNYMNSFITFWDS